jgi:hypothetical protein
MHRILARHLDLKECALAVSGLHIHGSAVHENDLLHDVKAQSESLILAGLALAASKRLKEVR